MNTKLLFSSAFLTLLLSTNVIAVSSECILPIPDGGDVSPSPPSISGIITNTAVDKLTLRDSNREVIISYDKETQLFSVYGGIVFAREIKVGQYIFVWYADCKESPQNLAAVIQFCSTEAEPCLK